MDAIKYFKALSDETRLRLLHLLLHHELKVGELVSVLDMGQSRISRHLKILAEAGLVDSLKEGVWGLYFAVKGGPGREFINSIQYLLKKDPVLQADLVQAAQVIEERRLTTQRFFSTIANSWELLKQEILGDFDLNQIIVNDMNNPAVAADLGCGTGDLLERMAPRAGKLIGVDSAPGMLARARKRFDDSDKRIEVRLGELEHLPLGNSEVDLAVVSLVLQYLEKPAAAIAEAARVIRPDGHFILADFERHRQTDLREKYGARWLGFDTEEVTQWLASNGFVLAALDRHPLEQGLAVNVFQCRRQAV